VSLLVFDSIEELIDRITNFWLKGQDLETIRDLGGITKENKNALIVHIFEHEDYATYTIYKGQDEHLVDIIINRIEAELENRNLNS
jgi:hypothetical protein